MVHVLIMIPLEISFTFYLLFPVLFGFELEMLLFFFQILMGISFLLGFSVCQFKMQEVFP